MSRDFKCCLVSVVIPARNEATNLAKTLPVLSRQSCCLGSIELIVVDNGSTDDTAAVAGRFGAMVVSGAGPTIASLRNRGAAAARGEALAFLDADCVPHVDWLQRALEHLCETDVCIVGTPERPPAQGTWVEFAWSTVTGGDTPAVRTATWCSSQSLVVKRAVFDAVGGFSERFATCEDVDFCYRSRSFGRVVVDGRVPHTHLGGSRTLVELFRRELWRGTDNVRGFFAHGNPLAEAPSTFGPVVFAGLLAVALGGALLRTLLPAHRVGLGIPTLCATGAALSMPGLMIFWKRARTENLRRFLSVYVVCSVYLAARASALFVGGRRVARS